jgi:hypothetical protein
MVNCGVQMILGFVLGMGLFAVLIGIKKIRVRQAVGMIKKEDKIKEEIFESAKAEVIKAKEGERRFVKTELTEVEIINAKKQAKKPRKVKEIKEIVSENNEMEKVEE